MTLRRPAVWIVVVIGGSLLVAGCGPKAPPGAIWVTGSVRFEGKPLPEGAVHFLAKPEQSGSGRGSVRLSPASGFGLYLKPGDYAVAVVSEEGVAEMDMKTGRLIPAKSRIPLKYTTVNDSGLEARVDANHRTVHFNLAP